ncbi:hypothetical protein MmiAt1_06720 [Methanimicrococcus sp. At1]|uniref:Uncharacterized protein n=1 Tax=Methanimicrococcus hacksteinii TaxID=3028293 RepID=A0ABU3VP83_9EURY|nr:hypothetical protein [Methanimicrococcus sp. At1]MDV0445115.1 hypothetical protein [Methanimicrococcus sp. At1]
MHHLIFITSARYASVGTDYLRVSVCTDYLRVSVWRCCLTIFRKYSCRLAGLLTNLFAAAVRFCPPPVLPAAPRAQAAEFLKSSEITLLFLFKFLKSHCYFCLNFRENPV